MTFPRLLMTVGVLMAAVVDPLGAASCPAYAAGADQPADAQAEIAKKRELAASLAAQGKLSEAVVAAEEAFRLSGGRDGAAAYTLAALYYELGRPADAEPLVDRIVASQPSERSALLLKGLVKLDLGNFDEAEPALTEAARGDASQPWARLGLAVLMRARGRADDAEAALAKLVADKPDWSLAHFQLGVTRLVKKQPEAALTAFDAAERTGGGSPEIRLRTARVLLAANEPALAVDRARPLLRSSVAQAARTLIVQAEMSRRAPDAAERVLREAVDADPNDVTARLQFGRFLLERGRARDALAQFDRAGRARPDAPEPLAAKAEAHLALGEPAQAVAVAEQAVAARPDDASSYMLLGSVFERLGRGTDALATYRKFLDKSPNNLPVVSVTAALLARESRTAEAMKLLLDAAKAHPRSPVPLMEVAQIAERSGNPQTAVTAYREALRRAPDDPGLLNNLAYLLATDPVTLAEAGSLAERAYQKRPRSGSIADTFGWILYRQRSLPRAVQLLEQAAAALPEQPVVQYHLGVVYAELGKRTEARQALEQALKGPKFAERPEAQKLLDSLR